MCAPGLCISRGELVCGGTRMALFWYFQPVSRDSEVPASVPDYMPGQMESGMNMEEYGNVSAVASDLADPETSGKRKSRGKYTVYTKEDRATIGKYASESGNERARLRFLEKYPKLTESTVWNFRECISKKN